jgi:putative transcriptional regulator
MRRGRVLWGLAFLLALAPAPLGSAIQLAAGEAVPERSLAGKLLVAQPHLLDPNFRETVVFMVSHDPSGAFGLVVNRLIGSMDLAELIEAMGGDAEGASGQVRIHYGGPVQRERGFVLHSRDGRTPSIEVNEEYGVTVGVELLEALARGQGPKHSLIASGYAGWGSGQLERELARGDWVVAPADPDIVFDDAYDSKWRRALDSRYLQT